MSLSVSNKDDIIMRLVHYFVTEENYQPIIVNGVKNEIWLENLEAPYRIVRINSNYIHNDDQFKFDNFKVKSIAKQIKKKTLSFKMNTLNILLDLNDDVELSREDKNIDTYKIQTIKDIRKETGLVKVFPKLKTITLNKENNLDLIVNITNDINEKTEKDNKEYGKVFRPKKIIVTNILLIMNFILFMLCIFFPEVEEALILHPYKVADGEYWRLFTAAFLHGDIIHLLVNMYSLKLIGSQVETFLGRTKFLVVYLLTAMTAGLMSCIVTRMLSLGASGAIFGLLGCLLYFGYHYRLYLGGVLRNQIIPVILINLFIGFSMPMIDNAAHIGGLIGGIFIAMALGVGRKEDKAGRINGIITSSIYIGFLIYLLFIR